jgi:DNA primase catalytic core
MEIQAIKRHLQIETVLKHYNLQADRNHMLQCPFHEDDKPSLKIYSNTNTFNCFGCGANGDVIEFIQKEENCSKHKALLKATELCGNLDMGSETLDIRKPKEGQVEQAKHTAIFEKIFTSFQKGLQSGKTIKPKEYLANRKLWSLSDSRSGEMAKGVEVGYNSGQFHHRGKLSEKEMQACIAAGLLIPYSGRTPNGQEITYTPFAKECIIFPLKNTEDEIVSLYGRSILESKNSKHFYTANRNGLYPGYPNPETTKLILTEAIIDAATLLQLIISNEQLSKEGFAVLACYGTNGLTAEHKQAIEEWTSVVERSRDKEIIFFFDGDKAGIQAAEKYAKELSKDGLLSVSMVETPLEEDVNSLYVNYDKDAIVQLLSERKSLSAVKTQCLASPKEEKSTSNPVQTLHATSHFQPQAAQLNTTNPDYITYATENLQIILLGGINLQQLDRLRVTLKINRKDTDNPLHSIRHTLDLYNSDYLEKFIGKASDQLEIGTTVLKRTMAELIDAIEKYRMSKIESRKEKRPQERKLTESRTKRAIQYLSSKKLMQRTGEDIGKTGMIGEENNRLLMYLVFTSRLREQPLHIISLGASGTGKTYLQERVSELIPEQDKLEITMLSENAFYYFGQQELKNKLVLIEDMDGAEHVLYPLRELQSKKRISKTIPIKDSKGNLKTITMKVEGPICLAGTTTKEKLYEDNANRSLLIYLDNSKQHRDAIMNYQRKLSAGKIVTQKEEQMIEFFKDMQTVLKPIKVRNPYAEYLVIPEHVFKPLRTNSHYLAFIETITFYHQYQREVKFDNHSNESYIETTLEDIEWANQLLKEVLLAKADELPKAVRQFFESLKSWMLTAQKESFLAKDVRDVFRMHPSKIKRYLNELLRYNFIKVVGGNRYKGGLEYEVINTEEYKELESGITTALDNVLSDLKKKLSGSVDQQWSKPQNRPLKPNINSKLNAVVQ